MRHPAAGGELADLPRIERGLGGKVEAVEVAYHREVGDLARHLDEPLVLAGDLALDQKGQRLAQGQLTVAASSSRLSSWSRIAVSLSRDRATVAAGLVAW